MVLLAVAQLALAAPAPSGARDAGPAAAPRKAPPPTHVEAAHIEYVYKDRKTIMTGSPLVTFVREDSVLVCRKMTAFNDAAGDIQHAVCEGDVKLTRGEKIVTCNRATFDAPTNKIVCRGDPVLHDGASILYCQEVIYDLEQDKVFVKQGKGTIIQRPGQTLPGSKGKAK
jgi:hypothetical protein